MSYQLTEGGVVERETGKCIPFNSANVDYQRFQAWLAQGHQPMPMAQKRPMPVAEEYRQVNDWVKAVIVEVGLDEAAIQQRVDQMRKSR